MATTYFVGKAALDSSSNPINSPRYIENGAIVVVSTFTPATGVVNDVFNVVKVPSGAVITGVWIDAGDLDTGAAAVLAVGDATVPARFISGSNIGQAGGVASMNVQGGLGFTYAADTYIAVKITTAPAGFTAAPITLAITYTMTA